MSDMLPLSGTVVLDLSRMLPGAVLARTLIDLGARLIKIEEPQTGDPMRLAPPFADGTGAGFQAFYRGAESVVLDLKSPAGAEALRSLVARADVLVESFRPGTMGRWGLSAEGLQTLNPALTICSLSGFGAEGGVGHDLNLQAFSGLLASLPGEGIPGIQIADVTTGILASSSILAALLLRTRTGRGSRLDQPLASAPLPFLTWAWANASAGGTGVLEHILAGESPSYQVYRCADGERIALGAIEPKFWKALVELLEVPEVASSGMKTGARGTEAIGILAERFARHPRDHWLSLATQRDLPLSAVNDLASAREEPYYRGRTERMTLEGGGQLEAPGPYLEGWPRPLLSPAPALGAHTEAVFREFGLDSQTNPKPY
jgi:crotonobetainyl-CoA:carnitine CoA-transferase CaiB-like acyl-CoA transferase